MFIDLCQFFVNTLNHGPSLKVKGLVKSPQTVDKVKFDNSLLNFKKK